ncbi:MAG TPA: PAS domain S-box protein [Candidatus Sulfotelmatobacter sp.]|nr:PAS domain S-box protein [Candidatus Sulfotelmatobacter sp.]
MNRSPLSREDSTTGEFDPGILRRLNQFVSLCSGLAVAFGLWALAGWMFHIPRMKSILSGQVAVKANTAACFLLIGFALWILRKESLPLAAAWKAAAKLAAGLAALVGLLSLLECIWGWDLGIDQLLFTAGVEDIPGSVRPGLMSPLSALGFFALGLGLLLQDSASRLRRWSSQLLPCGVSIAAIFGVLDFVLDPTTTHTHISPITACLLFLFAFGVMFARPQWGLGTLVAGVTLGGALTRRLLPAAIFIPLAIGWLRWKGQNAGLFSDWAGVASMTGLLIVLLSGLTVWTGFTVDRSDRERRQGKENADRLASIVECSNDAIIGKTTEGIVTSWNPAAEAIYGYSAQEVIGRPISKIIPPDRQKEFDAILDRIRRNQRISHYETERVRKDGQIVSVSLSVSPVRDKAGNVVGISTITRDITERKRAEEKLRQASLYARSLIEASLDPLVTISKDGKITDVNQATEAVTGVSRDSLVGSDFSNYFTQPEKARQGYEQVFAEGRVMDYGLAIRHASGQLTEVLYNASVFKNEAGEIEGVFAAARDITRRKQVEDELRLSRERLALALKAGHSGTFDWDMQNNINQWSTEVEEVYGIAPGAFGGTYEDWEALVAPEDLATARKAIEESLKTGEFASEWRIRRRNDGEIRWITARAKVILDEAGQPQRMLGLNMDVTERKRAEEEVRRLNQELEQRVIQRTAQLEAANKELEAFTYSVSHDLRAPLRHISGFSKLLTEEYASTLAPEAQHHLQRIQAGTRQMGLLVDDLLNLGRIGRHEVRLQVTGLNSVINECLSDLKAECEGRHLEWKIGTLPFVECDAALMKQVFQNLLSNAVKFTRPRSQAVIEVGQKDQGGTAVVFVRDNGVGFSMKYADKLFGVFQRLHRPEDFEGTGVGLATVQRIIQKHGGRIWAEAELDKGATFYFTLGASEKTELQTKAATAGDQA